jgi:hypothetical protein
MINLTGQISLIIRAPQSVRKTTSELLSRCHHCTYFIHSSRLSDDRSKDSSKASSLHSAIQSFLLQMRVSSPFLNPLNTELNPICHLLILLGDLTFMGTYIVIISNKMQRYTVYLYLETALHVSGGISTHHQ